MATLELLTLFLASPGDVNAERAVVRRVVEEFNESLGKTNGIRVEVNGWETNARPAWGKDGQAIINEQIANMKSHALFVGIMWNRFGTKTPRGASGTAEEFDLALLARRQTRGKRPEIMFYFGTAPYSPKSRAESDQKGQVFDFKAAIEKKKQGLYWSFNGTADFEREFRKHYGAWLNKTIVDRKAKVTPKSRVVGKADPPKVLPAKAPKTAPNAAAGHKALIENAESATNSKAPRGKVGQKNPVPLRVRVTPAAPKATVPKAKLLILLDEYVFQVEAVNEDGAKWTIIIKTHSNEDETKARGIRDGQRGYRNISVAYQQQVGTASVESAIRSSNEKGDFWTLQLRFNQANNSAGPITFNGVSSDVMAQMRAEWLLLSQKPKTDASTTGISLRSDLWLESQLSGGGSNCEPIFPDLWNRVDGDSAKFRESMVLWATYRLISTGTCDSITELTVGAIRNKQVSIKFRGKRAPQWQGGKSVDIIVSGRCALES